MIVTNEQHPLTRQHRVVHVGDVLDAYQVLYNGMFSFRGTGIEKEKEKKESGWGKVVNFISQRELYPICSFSTTQDTTWTLGPNKPT